MTVVIKWSRKPWNYYQVTRLLVCSPKPLKRTKSNTKTKPATARVIGIRHAMPHHAFIFKTFAKTNEKIQSWNVGIRGGLCRFCFHWFQLNIYIPHKFRTTCIINILYNMYEDRFVYLWMLTCMNIITYIEKAKWIWKRTGVDVHFKDVNGGD